MIKIPILVQVALIYICGIVIGTHFTVPLPVIIPFLSISLFLFAVSCLGKFSKIRTPVFSIFLLFVFVFYANIYLRINIPGMEEFKDKSVDLTGVVISEPEPGKWQTNLIIKTETVNLRGVEEIEPINCKIFVRVRFPKKDIFYGEKYGFSGVLRIPEDEDFKNYLERHKISAAINVDDRKRIQYVSEGKANPLIKQILKLKKILANNLQAYISPNYFPVLGGMMLRTGAIPGQIREMFAKIGIVHVLAISGLHVWIMCGIFLIVLKLLNIPKRISFGITFFLIIIYAFITGLRVPVVRASLMVDLFLLGYIIRRRTDIFIALSTACLLILLWNPYNLFDIGFQLSFITVLSIVLITPRLEKLFNLPAILYHQQTGIQPIWPSLFVRNSFLITLRIFLVSIAAWLGSLPLVAYYFGYISWIGPVSNLFVIPLVTLILASGFILLISIGVLPFLAAFFAYAVNFLLFLLLKISEIMSSWSFVYSEVPKFNLSIVVVYYIVLAGFLFYPKLKEFKYAS